MLSQHLITQDVNGIKAKHTIKTGTNQQDLEHSLIIGGDLYPESSEKEEEIAVEKDSDDKIVIGYTKQGLPYQIVLKGFPDCDAQAIFDFVNQNIVALLNVFADMLISLRGATTKSVDKAVKSLIREIYRLRDHHIPAAVFTMGIAVVYKREDQLFCAGFSIGDAGFLLRSPRSVTQLGYTVRVDGGKDAFAPHLPVDRKAIIKRTPTFFSEVAPDQEIIGYTNLLIWEEGSRLGMLVEEPREFPGPDKEISMIFYKLRPDYQEEFAESDAPFVELLNAKIHEQIEKQEESSIHMSYLLGWMKIPDDALQITMQHQFQLKHGRMQAAHNPSMFLQDLESKVRQSKSVRLWHNRSNNSSERDWQLYISVKPTRENLYHAAKALSEVLCTTDIEFSCVYFANDLAINDWDGTLLSSPDRSRSDCDNRNKEACIFLRYSSRRGVYEKNAIEVKDLLLRCWKVLQDAGVETGYSSTPFATKEILVDDGKLPSIFSYASPQANMRDGLLASDDYNPGKNADPLRFTKISLEDLEAAGIDIHQVELMQSKRVEYLSAHRDAASVNITKQLQDAREGVTINKNLENVKQKLEVGSKYIKKKTFKEIEDLLITLEGLVLGSALKLTLRERCTQIVDIVVELFVRFPRLPNSILQRNVVINTWMNLVNEFNRQPKKMFAFISGFSDTVTNREIIKRATEFAKDSGVITEFNLNLSTVEERVPQVDKREFLVILEMLKVEAKKETELTIAGFPQQDKYFEASPDTTSNAKFVISPARFESLKKAEDKDKAKDKEPESEPEITVKRPKSELSTLVETSMPDMQFLSRLLKHDEHEQRALEVERERLREIERKNRIREQELLAYLEGNDEEGKFISFDDYTLENIQKVLDQVNTSDEGIAEVEKNAEEDLLSTSSIDRLAELKQYLSKRIAKIDSGFDLAEIIEVLIANLAQYLIGRIERVKDDSSALFRRDNPELTRKKFTHAKGALLPDLIALIKKLNFHLEIARGDFIQECADELRAIVELAIEENKLDERAHWKIHLLTKSGLEGFLTSTLGELEKWENGDYVSKTPVDVSDNNISEDEEGEIPLLRSPRGSTSKGI